MDKINRITECLFQWLNTFELAKGCQLNDLCDGVILAEVLNFISPEYFNSDWKSKIRTDVSADNWRLRMSNLKKIQDQLVDFYSDVLNQPLLFSSTNASSFKLPDLKAISKDYDLSELAKLVQLILVCAVNCERKQDHIKTIMELELAVQHGVMQAIQEILLPNLNSSQNAIGKEGNDLSLIFPDSLNIDHMTIKEQMKRQQDELQTLNEIKDNLSQKNYEYEKTMKLLKEEKENLLHENDRLTSYIKQLSPSHHHILNTNSLNNSLINENRVEKTVNMYNEPSDESLRDNHYRKLETQMTHLQEQLIHTETIKDEYRLKIDLLEREILDIKSKNERLQMKANETRQLRDELDELHEQIKKYEFNEKSYKKKLEELNEFKKQAKNLEEVNQQLKDDLTKCTEEIKKSQSFKIQVDVYKKQIQDLQKEIYGEKQRDDEIELKYENLKSYCEQLVDDIDKLKKENKFIKSEFENFQAQHTSGTSLLINQGGHVNRNEVETISDELKNIGGKYVDEIASLKKQINKLQLDKKLSEGKINQLEAQLGNNCMFVDNNAIESLKSQLCKAEERINELIMIAGKKDEELIEMSEKYKKCVFKAREAVRALDTVNSTSLVSSPNATVDQFSVPDSFELSNDIRQLKNMIMEKDKFIQELETENEKNRSLWDMESRLMTIAFHGLSSTLQRKSAGDRITNATGAINQTNSGTFLTRQRQATSRRFTNQTLSQSEY